jgi:MFS family permease
MSAVATAPRASALSRSGSASASADPWAPFRIGIFRAIWIAALVSNLGSWMHLIAASWLMTSLTASAALVALLQTAGAAPSVALALPAGAMADVFDRRRLIIVTQGYQAVIAAGLGAITPAGATTPAVLLAATLALGVGATLGLPAYSAITPELVPGDELPAAISLNTITWTAAQAAGPALGGLLVAAAGAGAVFLINAASFIAVVAVIVRWRRPKPTATLPPEHVGSAIRTGLRYARNAPELRTVLIRCAAYVTVFSALPALLAVTTRTRLGGSALAFGVLLGLVGLGGIAAAVLLPRFRTRFRTDLLVGIASVAHAGVMVAVASLHSIAALAPVMVVSGFALMTVMSSLNIAAQVVLPAWVRGRGLAIFQLVFQLGFAGGAALWGALAASDGIPTALTVAAIAMLASTLLAVRYRLDSADGIDVRPATAGAAGPGRCRTRRRAGLGRGRVSGRRRQRRCLQRGERGRPAHAPSRWCAALGSLPGQRAPRAARRELPRPVVDRARAPGRAPDRERQASARPDRRPAHRPRAAGDAPPARPSLPTSQEARSCGHTKRAQRQRPRLKPSGVCGQTSRAGRRGTGTSSGSRSTAPSLPADASR